MAVNGIELAVGQVWEMGDGRMSVVVSTSSGLALANPKDPGDIRCYSEGIWPRENRNGKYEPIRLVQGDKPVAHAEPENITTDAAALAAETLSALGWRFDGRSWVQDVPKSLPRGEALTEFVSTLGRGESAGTSALDVQIGGSHYKSLAIQPMEYSIANKLDACQHTIIKYVTRFRDKGGIDDLKKARHTIDLLIEFEGKQS